MTYEEENKRYLENIDSCYRTIREIHSRLFTAAKFQQPAQYSLEDKAARAYIEAMKEGVRGTRAFTKQEITEREFKEYMLKRQWILDA